MSTVFADAFYFVGLINRTDQHPQDCHRGAPTPFRPPDNEADSHVIITRASSDLFQRGLQRYEERRDKHWSLRDCISFVVMEENGIREALTGDQHFEQAGFVALLK